MATNIPPHNLVEVVDALLHLTDNPKSTSEDLMQFVKGPIFLPWRNLWQERYYSGLCYGSRAYGCSAVLPML